MQEKSLKIIGADTSFIGKISFTLNKIIIPTKIGFNSFLITMKRNTMLKSYENFVKCEDEKLKKEFEEKYLKTYEMYLDVLDKYIMDNIYKKVKNNTATPFERNAIVLYSQIVGLKEKDYDEYKYKKQKYLLDLDFEGIKNTNKEKQIKEFSAFYLNKVDSLFKALLKTYSIKIANISEKEIRKNAKPFENVFETLQNYIDQIVPLKIENDEKYLEKIPEYSAYEKLSVGKNDTRDILEKNVLKLTISRHIFTHSLPLAVIEKCYKYILYKVRELLQDTKIVLKKENVYNLLLNLIEEYKVNLLKNKVYWETQTDKTKYKEFYKKYQEIQKLKESNLVEYIKEKEILFIYSEISDLQKEEIVDYTQLTKYFRRKLVDFGRIKELPNKYTSKRLYIRKKDVKNVRN